MTSIVPDEVPSEWENEAWPEIDADSPGIAPGKPRVDITIEKNSFEALLRAMSSPNVPSIYVRSGGLTRIEQDDKGEAKLHRLNSDNLLAWFAENVDTYAMKPVGRGQNTEWKEVPTFPSSRALGAILGREKWRLPRLIGIVTSPVIRPDGTLLYLPGFDGATGLFHFPKIRSGGVPPKPTKKDVDEARKLLLLMLSGFPWVHDSDRAQYLALAFTPILRPSIQLPTPMGLITATTMGSGKSYLTYLFEELYGMGTLPWPRDSGDELRKAITAKLTQSGSPVITFDNVDNGGALKSPLLADLITKSYWEDRILGQTATVGAPNDRLWLATGNNLRTGGDMARRVLWVRLDPDCPDPDRRRDFEIGDFRVWLRANAPAVLRALLVIVVGWVQAGAPKREDAQMGGFTEWTKALGGLLDWAEIPGFMDSRDATSIELDEEAGEWYTLLAHWYQMFETRPMSLREVLAEPDISEHLPLTNRNEKPVARQFGQWCSARMGRYYGEYRLVRHVGPKNTALWSVANFNEKVKAEPVKASVVEQPTLTEGNAF